MTSWVTSPTRRCNCQPKTRRGACVQALLPGGQVCPPLGTTAYSVTAFPTTNAAMIALGAPTGTLALSAGVKKNGSGTPEWFTNALDQRAKPFNPNAPAAGG